MKLYYFDNSATSNPKPENVYKAVNYAMTELNSNPGRGGHRLAVKSAQEIYSVRKKIAEFFNCSNPLNVAFTNNSTTALNIAVKSLIKNNGVVVTTFQEHNSVLRPVFTVSKEKKSKILLASDVEEIIKYIDENIVDLVVVNHMSNVTGKTLDIEKIGKKCRGNNVKFVVDASQSAGIIPIDIEKMNIDALCITGHKSLYGIQGIGAVILGEGTVLNPLFEGGTGSHSREMSHPKEMPEALEAGTVNTPGILSLGAGIDFILNEGIEKIYNHERHLKEMFIEGLKRIDKKGKIEIYSSYENLDGPVVSINIAGVDSGELSYLLDEEFGIITRSGLHCAPLIHEKNKTENKGMVRFSFGYFNTEEEINHAIESIEKILMEL